MIDSPGSFDALPVIQQLGQKVGALEAALAIAHAQIRALSSQAPAAPGDAQKPESAKEA